GFGGLVHLLPKRGGGAFVGVGAADGSLERVGHGLEQDRVLILRLLAGEEGNSAARAAEHLAAIGNDVRAFSPGRTPMWAVTVALPWPAESAVTSSGWPRPAVRWSRRCGSPYSCSAAICSIMAL